MWLHVGLAVSKWERKKWLASLSKSVFLICQGLGTKWGSVCEACGKGLATESSPASLPFSIQGSHYKWSEVQKDKGAGPGPLSCEDKINSCILCQLTPLPVCPLPKYIAFPGTFQWPRVILLSLILRSYWIWSPCLCPMIVTLHPIYHCSTKWKESISSAFTAESWSWTWVRIRIS